MRLCAGMLLMFVLCLGCNRAEEARRKAVQNNLKQIELALENYHKTHGASGSELSESGVEAYVGAGAVKPQGDMVRDVPEVVDGSCQ